MSQTDSTPLPEFSFPLFVPGDRPERIPKAWASGADAIIIDLEDAVAAADKDKARSGIGAAMVGRPDVKTYLRINSVETEWYDDDLKLFTTLDFDGVVLPKAETVGTLQSLRSKLHPYKKIIALIESAKGLANVRSIAPECDRIAFGSIDYCADLGIQHTQTALLHARSEIVLASRLAGLVGPLDGVTTAVSNIPVIKADASHSSELGFTGKLLIHPAQISPAREGFVPSKSEILWAQQVMNSGADAGAVSIDGLMVDGPVLVRARAILDRKEALT
ncbi:MAG: CoA ester lyase [Rhizobiaceae bacterium]